MLQKCVGLILTAFPLHMETEPKPRVEKGPMFHSNQSFSRNQPFLQLSLPQLNPSQRKAARAADLVAAEATNRMTSGRDF